MALCQKQNDAGNLKESAKDNSGGGGGGEGGREDNEKAGRRREGDVGGENGGINVDNDGGAPGIRPTKSPTMRRKIRHACSPLFAVPSRPLFEHIPKRQSCCYVARPEDVVVSHSFFFARTTGPRRNPDCRRR